MLFLLALLFPLHLLFGSIVEVDTLYPIKVALEDADEDDLIIFDVDCTLMVPNDMVLRPCGVAFFYEQFDLLNEMVPEEHLKLLGSTILLQRSVTHVEVEMPLFVRHLQERSLKVIALTALFTGRFGAIRSMEEWRNRELKQMGFDFSGAFPRYNHIIFGDIMREGSLPIFKDGVLFSARHTKGEVLRAFLGRVKWKPKRIFFIDDMREYLESVENVLKDEDIEYHGFHYLACKQLGDQFDKEIAERQFTHLRTHDEWLGDTKLNTMSTP